MKNSLTPEVLDALINVGLSREARIAHLYIQIAGAPAAARITRLFHGKDRAVEIADEIVARLDYIRSLYADEAAG